MASISDLIMGHFHCLLLHKKIDGFGARTVPVTNDLAIRQILSWDLIIDRIAFTIVSYGIKIKRPYGMYEMEPVQQFMTAPHINAIESYRAMSWISRCTYEWMIGLRRLLDVKKFAIRRCSGAAVTIFSFVIGNEFKWKHFHYVKCEFSSFSAASDRKNPKQIHNASVSFSLSRRRFYFSIFHCCTALMAWWFVYKHFLGDAAIKRARMLHFNDELR